VLEVLEGCASGGVGPTGHTLEEMRAIWAEGKAVENDASYDVCQHAWNLVHALKKAIVEEQLDQKIDILRKAT
jgi:hypothetical protein